MYTSADPGTGKPKLSFVKYSRGYTGRDRQRQPIRLHIRRRTLTWLGFAQLSRTLVCQKICFHDVRPSRTHTAFICADRFDALLVGVEECVFLAQLCSRHLREDDRNSQNTAHSTPVPASAQSRHRRALLAPAENQRARPPKAGARSAQPKRRAPKRCFALERRVTSRSAACSTTMHDCTCGHQMATSRHALNNALCAATTPDSPSKAAAKPSETPTTAVSDASAVIQGAVLPAKSGAA